MHWGDAWIRAWPLRRRSGLLAALVLATLALAGLSIQAVYREAQVRRRLIADTHRSIADVVTARLDAAMADSDRVVASEVQAIDPRAEALLRKLQELEASRPWLEPLVLVSVSSRQVDSPQPKSATDRFDELLAAAERAEHREDRPGQAARLYATAAAQATGASRRAAALNGEARTELKAGDPRRAAGTYKRLIAETETLDEGSARLSLIARHQVTSCYKLLGNERDFADAALNLYEFLIGHRFVLDEDTYDFYRRQVEEALADARPDLNRYQADGIGRLRAREQRLRPLAAALRTPHSTAGGEGPVGAPAVAMTAIGNTGAQVAHVWEASNVRALLDRSLAERGPWSGIGVALLEEGAKPAAAPPTRVPADAARATLPLARAPRWRVAAFPQSGSLDALASREVIRFAALLVLVFGSVVSAMVLAARSVARELALSRTRSEFVASVSHELKTPLSLIRMFAESLREGWVAEDKRAGYYEVITRESERLTGLINNVLEFSRIESATRKYQRATADLRAILAGLLGRYRYHLNAANIDLIEELPPEPVYAYVDSDAIEQVLVNLLSNAVKYMGDADRRPREVRVSLANSGEHTVIRIADTGIGIAAEHRTHIYERFWRGDDERVRAVAGSGLGLTLVKHIVEGHDGAIAVESVPGHGSTFAVTLPAGGRSRL